MALTYTIAGVQTQLDAAWTAIQGRNFVTAREAIVGAELIWAQLPQTVQASTSGVTLRASFENARKAINELEAASVNTDRRRLIRTGLRHE